MSLLSLPTEILRKIFYNLEQPLTNVALVCRRLRDIAEPILYEEFSGEMPSALEGYMKAIIRRPELQITSSPSTVLQLNQACQ